MKGYKGHNKDLSCRNRKYKVGEKYEEKNADLCHCGSHFCENALDVFNYYPPTNSRYTEIEAENVSEQKDVDTKRCAKSIKICAEIGIKGIVEAAVSYIFEKAKKDNSATTGDGANSATTGDGANSATTGDDANSATTGDGANSATTGYHANSATGHKNSVSAAIGIKSAAKGVIGSWIVLSDWKYNDRTNNYEVEAVKAVQIDGKIIKENTWYKLIDGKFVEFSDKEI